jgi:hypothetical protein
MEPDQATSAPAAPAVDAGVRGPARGNRAVIILSVVAGVLALVVVGLAVTVGYLWGERSSRSEDYYMDVAPSAEEQEAWVLAEQMAMDVGYLIVDGDLDAYLDLYKVDDPHMDRASVEADFNAVAEKARALEGQVEYMSDSMPILYEDESTGETIVRVTVAGTDFESGRSSGGRLTVYVLLSDDGTTLTGREGRELKTTGTIW